MANVEYYSGAGDGHIKNITTSGWATTRAATSGSDSDYTSVALYVAGEHYNATSWQIARIFLPFDTSGLDDGVTIDSATVYFKASANSGGSPSVGVVSASQANTSELVNADFDNIANTEFATRVTSFSSGTYVQWTLNSSGLANISKTSYSKFGMREGNDIDDSDPAEARAYQTFYLSEESGTTNDPYISIDYTEGSAFIPKIMMS